eukprot:CAMPEP_0183598826 /NCGR_PEP_ID=MMETSP0371-20130417/179122_1 /TAXON_ID=268820 /ORGANISM="Peridinium aciculiferum, Strain PAER-2" /LENGTH=156 /DNA_ID=CAMNT_0025810887 /DNA_START=59 /DNA_END=530 /DNA_ORIENTATION=-
MARRARTSTLSFVFALGAALLVAQWALTPLAAAFISPRAEPKHVEVPAVLGALAALATSLPAQASYNWVGPLTGSEICNTKPIVLRWALAACPGVVQLGWALDRLRDLQHQADRLAHLPVVRPGLPRVANLLVPDHPDRLWQLDHGVEPAHSGDSA